MKSVCPWDLGNSFNAWAEFKKKKMTNEELLKMVNFSPVHLHNNAKEMQEWNDKYEMYTPVQSKKKLEKMFELAEEEDVVPKETATTTTTTQVVTNQ